MMAKAKNLICFADYRAKLNDKSILVVHAGTSVLYMNNARVSAIVDGKPVSVTSVQVNNKRASVCYRDVNVFFNCEYLFMLKVPDGFRKARIRVAFGGEYEGARRSYTVDGRSFRRQLAQINASIDEVRYEGDLLRITGWCADSLPVKISLEGAEGYQVRQVSRNDVSDYYQEDELSGAAGFLIELPRNAAKKVRVIMETSERRTVKTVRVDQEIRHKQYGVLQTIASGIEYCRTKGLARTLAKVGGKLSRRKSDAYHRWIKKHETGKAGLRKQRKIRFEKEPVFSIIVPVYRPDRKFFTGMLESVRNQTYPNWELCLADGGGEGFFMEDCVRGVFGADGRVKYKALSDNTGISGNTNEAMALASGDFIVLVDHDDLIRPDALFECARAINESEDADVLYTDEDKFDTGTGRRFDPHFKPDFNLYLLRSCNYITHLFVFSRELSRQVGGFNKECDGAQDYDMILRCVEKARHIRHIPKVLYHWRCHENSTAQNTDAKSYAYEAGVRALQGHYKRQGIEASVTNAEMAGYYRTVYELKETPLISIIIPNKDHRDDLENCLKSILGRQSYERYEILIAENNSEDAETFAYYKTIESEYDCVRVLYYDGAFNYSRINNFAAGYAKGEYLLLLNNDTEMIGTDCLRELVSVGLQPEVGAVGAKLLYGDEIVQHAGVIVGLAGVAGHAFLGERRDQVGYFARASIAQNYSAVTAACMLVRKSVYDEVGGFEEELSIAYNDVDFCLKIREKNYLIVYDPAAELYHYESKSRGTEDTPEKLARFEQEVSFMLNKWKKVYEDGDPNYNPNLTLKSQDFSLRE